MTEAIGFWHMSYDNGWFVRMSIVDKLVKTKITSYKGAGLVLLTMAECFSQTSGDGTGENPNMFKNAIMVYMENNHCEE